jgi:quercetin 2,3-dioxygenase
MQLISSQDIDIEGFAGLRERHYVMDGGVFGDHRNAESAQGLGALVYLADAHFLRFGSTGRHSHRDIDIVTLVCNGRLLHRGTLGDETLCESGEVLIQRAGQQGFEHNESNPDERPNRIIQIWMLPVQSDAHASHEVLRSPGYGRMTLYQSSSTRLELLTLHEGEQTSLPGEGLMYLVDGHGQISEGGVTATLADQSLVRGANLHFIASASARMLLASAL